VEFALVLYFTIMLLTVVENVLDTKRLMGMEDVAKHVREIVLIHATTYNYLTIRMFMGFVVPQVQLIVANALEHVVVVVAVDTEIVQISIQLLAVVQEVTLDLLARASHVPKLVNMGVVAQHQTPALVLVDTVAPIVLYLLVIQLVITVERVLTLIPALVQEGTLDQLVITSLALPHVKMEEVVQHQTLAIVLELDT